MNKVKLGIIGCGDISRIYARNCSGLFANIEIAACASSTMDKAEALAAECSIAEPCSVGEILANEKVEIILNLTNAAAHAGVSIAALEAGKHVYSEKPLATSQEDCRKILETAKRKGLRVGCAPDTFMGAGLQTASKIIHDGWIGQPVGFTAFVRVDAPERWHPDPGRYYKTGSGPLLEMGPYYITALSMLLGSVKRVSGMASTQKTKRMITSSPRYGEVFEPEIPTYVVANLEIEGNVFGTMTANFGDWGSKTPCLEIYGTEGTVVAPDPNNYCGPVLVKRKGNENWFESNLVNDHTENSRGIGVADMADALRKGRKPRANGETALYVVEVLEKINHSVRDGKMYDVHSSCGVYEPLYGNINETFYL